MSARRHRYLTILGSCATADSFRTAGWPTFVDPGIRVHDYIGRTAFPSLVTAGLDDDEWTPTDDVREDTAHQWSYLMALGEVTKTHAPRLIRGAKTSDVLVFDIVSSFLFRELALPERGGPRVLLESWELERFVRLRTDARGHFLWELPYEPQRDAAIAFLERLREVRPSLRLGFHVAPICLNDGVRFKVEILNERVDFYYAFAERLSGDLERAFPDLATLQAERTSWGADPAHPYGRYPFHYALDYYVAFRRLVKRWLDLPDDAVAVAPRTTD